jgi:hypothetical protein
MTVWPPCAATKSFTFEDGATPKWFPPMKCEGRSYFAALLLGAPFFTPLVAMVFVGMPMEEVFEKRVRKQDRPVLWGRLMEWVR